MEINIQKRTRNPLLNREEITCFINFDQVTPSREEIREAVAKEVMAKKEFVVINKIKQLHGTKQIRIKLRVYNSAKEMEIEPSYKLKRGIKEGEEKKEEKPEKKEEKK
jgi:ribosomal protein S24E